MWLDGKLVPRLGQIVIATACVTIRIHSAGFDCLSLELGLICVQGES